MKGKMIASRWFILADIGLVLIALLLCLAIQPALAASPASHVGGDITEDTTWTLAGSPYQVDSYVKVLAGVTLTIEAGVVVENYTTFPSYNFDVEGTLVANGSIASPIHFLPGSGGWSGIRITGQPGAINTGSSLRYVIVDGGGQGGSGVGGNLVLQYSHVDVLNCEFINSPGDGILGDDATAGGVADVSTSSFTNNAGYAINFENGSVNPILHWLTATGNGSALGYEGNLVNINDAILHGAHTWEDMGLPYLILSTIVATDSNLIIEPGVQVLSFPGNDNLDVHGFLLAHGATGEDITFEPLTPTLGWSGIAFMGTEELPGAGGDFDGVVISKGGFGGNCNVYIAYGNVTMANAMIRESGTSGVCLDHGASLVMTSTTFMGNQEYAMDVYDANALFFLDGLIPFMNGSNAIGIEGGTMTGPHTWQKSGINTYDLHYSYVTIAPTGTLTIEPGVSVLFGEARDITVKGTLNAIGTAAEPILFSGETITPGVPPTPGWWINLNFIGTPEHHAVGNLAYATVEYGGYGGSAMISIENADVIFNHCILRYSAGDAIEVLPGGLSASAPHVVQAAQPTRVNWSQLYAIGGYAINNDSDLPVEAAYNWWGAASGPTADGNPGGTGSSLLGPVHYWPFLIALEARFVFLPLARK